MPSTDLDLTAAVAAAARNAYDTAVRAHAGGDAPLGWRELTESQRDDWRTAALPFVIGAAPLIAGQALDHEARLVPDHDAGPYLTGRAWDYYGEEAGA